MGQIRNVMLIIIITAIMAILTSVFAYFFDYLTTNILRYVAKSLFEYRVNFTLWILFL
jgi:hypothetical protein